MGNFLILSICLLGTVLGQEHENQIGGIYTDDDIPHYVPGISGQLMGRYYYGGQFTGTCARDGLYWMDDTTFAICSHGYPYYQPCAPGTRHSGQHRYQPGYYYGYSDFCDVNLIDVGYMGREQFGSRTSYIRRINQKKTEVKPVESGGEEEKRQEEEKPEQESPEKVKEEKEVEQDQQ